MKRLIVGLTAALLMLASISGTALAGSPAVHFSFDPTGVVLDCGANQYTVMSGTILAVGHSNDYFSTGHETFRASAVLVQKNGEAGPTGPLYRMVGAETHGIEASAWTGGHAAGDTYDYNILGTGDSIHMVVHADSSAPLGFSVTSHGTCNAPG
jgi:hypothetical protein